MTSLDDLEAIMAERLRAAGLHDDAPTTTARNGDGSAALSEPQLRMWLAHQQDPDSTSHNISVTLGVAAAVDLRALAEALTVVADAQDILRTVYRTTATGDPIQLVSADVSPGWEVIDLRTADPDVFEHRVAMVEEREATKPFDLSVSSSLRVTALTGPRESPDSSGNTVLVLTAHHIAWDDNCLDLLLTQWFGAYGAIVSGAPDRVEVRRQYIDLTVANVPVPGTEDDLAYWRSQLTGRNPNSVTTGRSHAAPAGGLSRAGTLTATIGPSLTERIHDHTRQAGITRFSLLLTAFKVTLAQFSGAREFIVGTPVVNRDHADADAVIGYFGNTLALPVTMDLTQTFAHTSRRTAEQSMAGFAHQNVDFHQVRQAVRADRATDTELFEVMFGLRRGTRTTHTLGGTTVVPRSVNVGAAAFPLSLFVEDAAGTMSIEVVYATEAFTADETSALLAHYTHVLAGVLAEPDMPLCELAMLNPREAGRIGRWSRGPIRPMPAAPQRRTVDAMLAHQATVSPDSAAVHFADSTLTYREFHTAVDGLARRLIDRGVNVGDRVAVLLERGPALPIALAAVLRAGGTCLPIDTAYPADRIQHLLTDAAPSTIVIDAASVSDSGEPVIAGAAIEPIGGLVVVDDRLLTEARSADPVEPVTDHTRSRTLLPDDPAYLIYTSGTTGEPKGVVITHAAMCSRLQWAIDRFGTGGVGLAKSAVGFVDAATELLSVLARGGTLVVAAPDTARDPVELARLVHRHQVTDIVTVPVLAAALSTAAEAEQLSSIRRWICSGEVLGPALATKLGALVPGAEIINLYGCTEITGDATAGTSAHESLTRDQDPPVRIGSPVPNTEAWVLDSFLRPVPPGVAGELYLGGAQLAQGYHGRAGRTAERFIANPCAGPSDRGSRLYRTGDLARWTAAGELEFLGRGDDQVKIRGHRIELTEIRSALEAHPAVVSAAATTFTPGNTDELALAAYYCTDEATVDAAVLRTHLAQTLPEYMIPIAFTRLEILPLSANGKLDRGRLPAPVITATPGRAPQTPSEMLVAEHYRKVLRADGPITVGANFFHLGGHSLLATRLAAEINARIGSELTLRSMFDAPTVTELARLIDTGGTHRAPRPMMVATPRPQHIPASHGQRALWLIDRMSGPSAQYNVPMVLRLHRDAQGPAAGVVMAALDQSVRDVVVRHEPLRTLLVENEEQELFQHILSPDDAARRVSVAIDTAPCDDTAAAGAVSDLVREPFALGQDIPVRGRVLLTSSDGLLLALSLHHTVIDEWSVPTLLADLSAAFQSRIAGQVPAFTPLPMQYADYAVWQRQHLGDRTDPDSALAHHLDHWARSLAGIPSTSAIAADRPRPQTRTHAAADITFGLDKTLTDRLRLVAQRQSVSMFMVVQAAVAVTASRLGAGEDVVIGSPVGGRSDNSLTNLIGYLANPVPLRHDLGDALTLAEVLHRARATVLDGFAHQDAPFDHIVHAVGAGRATGHNPLFQTMVTYRMDTPVPDFGSAMSANFETVGTGTVKTDLDLYVVDGDSGINGIASYATELFDASTIERFTATLIMVFEAMADDLDVRLADLDLLTRQDRDRIAQWSSTPTAPGPSGAWCPIDCMLAAEAARCPQTTAVIFGDITLSYAEFDARVNRLARALIARGVRVGDRVAAKLSRDHHLPVAMAAIIRAGASYVPIDPALPNRRIEYLLADCGPALVLQDSDVTADLTGFSGAAIGDLERDRPIHPADAACVIYTSGTTGLPKGVVIPHATLAHRLRWARGRFGTGGIGLAKSGAGFIDATTEILSVLVRGGTLVIADQDSVRDAERLASLIGRHRVTDVVTVPTLARALVSTEGAADNLLSVQRWICSGERLSRATASAIGEVVPAATVINLYGSTEVTGDVTHEVAADDGRDRPVPVGVPFSGTTVRVLDRGLRLVPPGVIGELHVGGAHLTRGYHRNPALTAERFIADPFGGGDDPGSRLYRTGDLVRWDSDGRLEYMGRSDFQVKIRGFRIELDEIGAVLQSHPAVRDCVVISRERSTGDQELAAYFTSTGSSAVAAGDLRAHLAHTLPDHMIPATFTEMPVLPVTANGKLDRTALPEPAIDLVGGPAPETATERRLIAIYAEALGLPDTSAPGVHDDFFRLGGDSISALRVVTFAKRHGITIDTQDVFRSPTIADLARRADAALARLADVAPAEPVPDSTGGDPTACRTATPPHPHQHRLRESGVALADFVLTEVQPIPSLPTPHAAEHALAQEFRRSESSRLHITPKSKLLWLSEVRDAADFAISSMITVLHRPDLDLSETIGEVAPQITDDIAIDGCKPMHLYLIDTRQGPAAVLAAHALIVDRPGLHQVLERITTDLLGPTAEPDDRADDRADDGSEAAAAAAAAPPLSEIVAHLDELCASALCLDSLDSWRELLSSNPQPADLDGVPVRHHTIEVPGSVRREDVLKAWHRAADSTIPMLGTLVDMEIDQRTVAGIGRDQSIDHYRDTLGPLTATYPVRIGASEDPPLAPAVAYGLLRHASKTGRKALRKLTGSTVLVTQTFAASVDDTRLEGIEQFYRVVFRFRILESKVEVSVCGPDSAAGLLESWARELRTP